MSYLKFQLTVQKFHVSDRIVGLVSAFQQYFYSAYVSWMAHNALTNRPSLYIRRTYDAFRAVSNSG